MTLHLHAFRRLFRPAPGRRTWRPAQGPHRLAAATAGAILALALLAPAGAAELHWRKLTGADMHEALVGNLAEGLYADGRSYTEEFFADMTTYYRDEEWQTEGTFRFEDDEICFAYPVAMPTGCFVIWQRSANCYDLYFVGEGYPAASFAQRLIGVGWDSRFWVSDAPPTCPAAQLT